MLLLLAGAPAKHQLPDECKLYVGNLPPVYDSAMLRQLFEPHAKVIHSAVITEPGSGMSKGFGFIHIPDPAQVSRLVSVDNKCRYMCRDSVCMHCCSMYCVSAQLRASVLPDHFFNQLFNSMQGAKNIA